MSFFVVYPHKDKPAKAIDVTKKNARTMTEKMVVRKYDPVARKHVEYKEGKIK